MKTLEEKAQEYELRKIGRREAFIAGYKARDMEGQPLLEACKKVVELRSLIEYGDVSESNQDEALVLFRLVKMCEDAIEGFTPTT